MNNLNTLLGCICKDTITGYEGVALARTDYLFGCSRFHLQPIGLTKDGAIGDLETFDFQQIEKVDDPRYSIAITPSKIKMGSLVKDSLTGTVGVVIGITVTCHGDFPSLIVQPKSLGADGAPAKTLHLAEPRVTVVEEPKPKTEPKKAPEKKPGGPRGNTFQLKNYGDI